MDRQIDGCMALRRSEQISTISTYTYQISIEMHTYVCIYIYIYISIDMLESCFLYPLLAFGEAFSVPPTHFRTATIGEGGFVCQMLVPSSVFWGFSVLSHFGGFIFFFFLTSQNPSFETGFEFL